MTPPLTTGRPGHSKTSRTSSDDIGAAALLQPSDTFVHRHIGPSAPEIRQMLETLGLDSLDDLADATVPESIRLRRPLDLGEARGESELLTELKNIAGKNKVLRSW